MDTAQVRSPPGSPQPPVQFSFTPSRPRTATQGAVVEVRWPELMETGAIKQTRTVQPPLLYSASHRADGTRWAASRDQPDCTSSCKTTPPTNSSPTRGWGVSRSQSMARATSPSQCMERPDAVNERVSTAPPLCRSRILKESRPRLHSQEIRQSAFERPTTPAGFTTYKKGPSLELPLNGRAIADFIHDYQLQMSDAFQHLAETSDKPAGESQFKPATPTSRVRIKDAKRLSQAKEHLPAESAKPRFKTLEQWEYITNPPQLKFPHLYKGVHGTMRQQHLNRLMHETTAAQRLSKYVEDQHTRLLR